MPGATSPQGTRVRNQTADALRGLACLAVLGSHLQIAIESGEFLSALTLEHEYGDLLRYLFRGSSVYFFIISGFVISSKLPEWNSRPGGLFLRATQRLTRILIVFWAALVVMGLLDLLKWKLTGKPWFGPTIVEVLSEFFLLANVNNFQQHRLIRPAWYLEADAVLLFLLVASYWSWHRIPAWIRQRYRDLFWILSIVFTVFSLQVQVLFPMGHGAEAPLRALSYFVLGVLAYYALSNRVAFACFLINNFIILYWGDHSILSNYLCTTGAVVVAWLLCLSRVAPITERFFDTPFFHGLNKLSFSIFLFNYILFQIGMSFARHFSPYSVAGLLAFQGCSLAAIVALAVVFRQWVQVPLLAWHDALWQRVFAGARKEPTIRSRTVDDFREPCLLIPANHPITPMPD
jgi:peptidoglycan/LPS O-acetylase OafA/YrhL